MSKVVLVAYVSLDGVVENPSWTVPYWNDELAAYQRDQLFASDALLLGRVTYEEFAAAWPSMTEEGDFGQRMNSLPKYIATNTLQALEWNATAIEGDVVEVLAKMKEQAGGDLLIYGSADLVGTLMAHDLIDEYRLIVYPTVVGKGRRLFPEGATAPTLQLADTVTFSTGAVSLVYQPVR
jgi:dihydrofolate reductase